MHVVSPNFSGLYLGPMQEQLPSKVTMSLRHLTMLVPCPFEKYKSLNDVYVGLKALFVFSPTSWKEDFIICARSSFGFKEEEQSGS